jgi:hypothetical protein
MRNAFATILLAVALGLIPVPANAQPITILHSFAGGANDGASPNGGLIVSGSTLYGMTAAAGAYSSGTLFDIGTSGTGYQVLRSFGSNIVTDAATPLGGLAQSGSTLYGLSQAGGARATTVPLFRSAWMEMVF